jgi:hypothetical protein
MPRLSDPLRARAFEAARAQGIRLKLLEESYTRWSTGAPPVPCIYGPREQARALDCRCDGCLMRLAAFYFDSILHRGLR